MNNLKRFKFRMILKRGVKYTFKKVVIKSHEIISTQKRQYRLMKSKRKMNYISDKDILLAIGLHKKEEMNQVSINNIRDFLSISISDINNNIKALTNWQIKQICYIADSWLEDKPIILEEQYNLSIMQENGHYPWQEDFISGNKYPQLFYTELKVGKNISSGDVKIPWELSRMQGLFSLAQAYLITDDNNYRDKIIWIINDFNKCNPCGYGVNWMCPMEVGIRILNILLAYSLIRQKLNIESSFHSLVLKMAIEHGTFISGNLERSGRQSNNHYIADLLGLLSISCAYPDFKKSKKWIKFASKELFREIKRQILVEGLSFEGSTSYGRLTGEMFYLARVMMRKANIKIPTEFDSRLLAISDAIKWLTPQDGRVPQIGDNDSGRIVVFGQPKGQEYQYLSSLIKYELTGNINELDQFSYEYIWLYETVQLHNNKVNYYYGLKWFKESGIIVYKTKDLYFLSYAIDSYKNDVPGHMHNDKLSFILQYKGKDFFVDPGTGVYTRNIKIRNQLRSTKSHNTVLIEQQEQNRFGNTAFSYYYDGTATITCNKTEANVQIIGKHDCYKERFGITHNRQFLISNKVITISDYYNQQNDEIYQTLTTFILHPNVSIIVLSQNELILSNDEVKIKLKTYNSFSIEKGVYSQKYNHWQETNIIVVKGTTKEVAISKVELDG